MSLTLRYIDAALDQLPAFQDGTPEAREAAAIREHLLIAKSRLKSIERRPAPAGSPEAWMRS